MGSFRQSRGAFHARTKREERRDTRARRMAEESGADDEDADGPEHQRQQCARSFEWWAALAPQEPPAEEEEGWSAKSMMFPSGLSSCWLARSQGAVTSPLVETQLQQCARSFEWWATLALQEPPAEEEEGWSAKSMMFPSGLSSCWLARSQGAVTSPLVETRAGLHSK